MPVASTSRKLSALVGAAVAEATLAAGAFDTAPSWAQPAATARTSPIAVAVRASERRMGRPPVYSYSIRRQPDSVKYPGLLSRQFVNSWYRGASPVPARHWVMSE